MSFYMTESKHNVHMKVTKKKGEEGKKEKIPLSSPMKRANLRN